MTSFSLPMWLIWLAAVTKFSRLKIFVLAEHIRWYFFDCYKQEAVNIPHNSHRIAWPLINEMRFQWKALFSFWRLPCAQIMRFGAAGNIPIICFIKSPRVEQQEVEKKKKEKKWAHSTFFIWSKVSGIAGCFFFFFLSPSQGFLRIQLWLGESQTYRTCLLLIMAEPTYAAATAALIHWHLSRKKVKEKESWKMCLQGFLEGF